MSLFFKVNCIMIFKTALNFVSERAPKDQAQIQMLISDSMTFEFNRFIIKKINMRNNENVRDA